MTTTIITAALLIAAGILYLLRCAECARLRGKLDQATADASPFRDLRKEGADRAFIVSSRFDHPGKTVYLHAINVGKALTIGCINTGDPALDATLAQELMDKINEIEAYNADHAATCPF